MRRYLGPAIVGLVTVGVTACGGPSPAGEAGSAADSSPSLGAENAAGDVTAEAYDPSMFGESAAVEHRWYPLQPGTRLDYRGSFQEDGERVHSGVTIIVTDLTKVIDGVRNVVVWERDYADEELVETELALFAQDQEGNIWHMGEYPEEWEEGRFVTAPAWVHGLAGATAGITIPGTPHEGTRDYAQGFAPEPINWVDRGRVYKSGEETCVPAGCYDDVVVIEEFEKDIPDAYQDKFYAPEVGVVRVGWRGENDESKEELELVEHRQLTPEEMAEVRADALELEERAYRISTDVWAQTARAESPAS